MSSRAGPAHDSMDSSEDEGHEDFKFVRKAIRLEDSMNDRVEFSTVDYTPLVNIKPVDLSAVLRPRKLCVHCRMRAGRRL